MFFKVVMLFGMRSRALFIPEDVDMLSARGSQQAVN